MLQYLQAIKPASRLLLLAAAQVSHLPRQTELHCQGGWSLFCKLTLLYMA